MELTEAYAIISKNLENSVKELGFSKTNSDENALSYKGEKGLFRLVHNEDSDILSFECAYEDNGEETQYNLISKTLFELDAINDKDCRSTANEIADEISSLFATKKKVDLEKVKMPKAVSRSKAKNGMVNYDTDSLANRFGVLFPDLKNEIKQNIIDYDEFLPETFFEEYGTPRVLDVMKNGTEAEKKKLFKMLNEVYEDGTNEVQDIIGVTILGEMKNDPELMAVADKYMIKYMADPVHEINKLTKKNNKWTKKLQNPPAYKPKKNKMGTSIQNALTGQMPQ